MKRKSLTRMQAKANINDLPINKNKIKELKQGIVCPNGATVKIINGELVITLPRDNKNV